MIATVQLKKRVTSTGILCIIIGKLSYGKEPSLIILPKIDKSLEIGLYNAILFLGLAVSWRVKGR